MGFVRETATVGGKEITIETGKWAKQASGSVVIRCGESMVLVTAAGSAQPRDIDFMPLTCEYQEKFYATGKIPGSFFRREGRTTNAEILICRLMDRPIRPLFPKGWFIDTQIIANVISFDKVNATDVLAMTSDPLLRSSAARSAPTAAFLERGRRHVQTVAQDFRLLPSWSARGRFVRQHLFPAPSYMRTVYAPHSPWPLPVLYLQRAWRGAWRWIVRT
jgi:polyribonucleotide nucleotidyltransferase